MVILWILDLHRSFPDNVDLILTSRVSDSYIEIIEQLQARLRESEFAEQSAQGNIAKLKVLVEVHYFLFYSDPLNMSAGFFAFIIWINLFCLFKIIFKLILQCNLS